MVLEAAVNLDMLSLTLRRILATIPGEISEREGLGLAWLAAQVEGGTSIVEIGSYMGRSTCYLAEGALRSEFEEDDVVPVHAVDLWEEAPWPQYADPLNRQAFREAISALRLDQIVVAKPGDSLAIAGAWTGAPIGLLFVDGNHYFDPVVADYQAWQRHIAPGGILALHDAADPHWGVRQAIDEVILPTGLWEPGPFITGDLATLVRRADA